MVMDASVKASESCTNEQLFLHCFDFEGHPQKNQLNVRRKIH